ncbi:hypothetical protein D5R81_05115 [Parashewanella spongiae]|uniref:Uncharacterized protein n=1 Tax=Parashewanella spongiae TaxID=342950 RepID=A0A3A6TZT3_9GAMM|nr:hypothetical protein [Parashewanella spongiae]MCL1076695.1 hypothetical protein [Parashewanella spongiae]RJY18503.1 hypothetical protein D5R81_05115 [Parashewanella spongiae]
MKLASTLPYQWSFCLLIFFVSFVPTTYAATTKLDYQLQGAVYSWYGQLDITPQKKGKNGAHHILSITPLRMKNGLTEVEVELEYLPQKIGSDEIVGHYQIQKILINPVNAQVKNTEVVLDEVDDFTSRYRSSSDTNLIRAFVYRWSQLLDNASTSKQVNPKQWQKQFSSKSTFNPEESGLKSIPNYLAYLSTLQMKNSRHEIKNLNIRAQSNSLQDNSTRYSVEFEYQWKGINSYDENELAQVGINIELEIKNGQIIIHRYKANYLPPVTDLGAEIRC